jgi:hypothetical protein
MLGRDISPRRTLDQCVEDRLSLLFVWRAVKRKALSAQASRLRAYGGLHTRHALGQDDERGNADDVREIVSI